MTDFPYCTVPSAPSPHLFQALQVDRPHLLAAALGLTELDFSAMARRVLRSTGACTCPRRTAAHRRAFHRVTNNGMSRLSQRALCLQCGRLWDTTLKQGGAARFLEIPAFYRAWLDLQLGRGGLTGGQADAVLIQAAGVNWAGERVSWQWIKGEPWQCWRDHLGWRVTVTCPARGQHQDPYLLDATRGEARHQVTLTARTSEAARAEALAVTTTLPCGPDDTAQETR